VVSRQPSETKNTEATITPNLLSKEFHSVWNFLNEQSVNIVQRILKDPNHPITTSFHRNKYNNNVIVPHTNTTQYQNSVLQKSLRIIRDGYVNRYTNPRRIETTTAAYHVEIQAKLDKTRPKTEQLSARFVYSKPKVSMALKYATAKIINKAKSLV
jgi:hypothetical protein